MSKTTDMLHDVERTEGELRLNKGTTPICVRKYVTSTGEALIEWVTPSKVSSMRLESIELDDRSYAYRTIIRDQTGYNIATKAVKSFEQALEITCKISGEDPKEYLIIEDK